MITLTDISIDKDKVIINDKFDFFLQEIGILFDTAPGEVLGEPTFGTEFENFIWDLKVSNEQISDYIYSAILTKTTSAQYFNISVDTKILYGTQNDIILVSINIRDKETNEEQQLTYKID